MASHAISFFDFLYDKIPTWLAHLRTVNEGIARRLSDDTRTDKLSTIDVCAKAGPSPVSLSGVEITRGGSELDDYDLAGIVVDDSLDELDDELDDGEEEYAGASPWPQSSTSEGLDRQVPRIGQKRKLFVSSISRPGKRVRRIKRRDTRIILYDSEAQILLNQIVKDIARAQSMVRFNAKDAKLDHLGKRLTEASDMIEDAAFQILKDGECRKFTNKAVEIFQEVFAKSRKEMEMERRDEESAHFKVQTSSQEEQDEKRDSARNSKRSWSAKVLAAIEGADWDSSHEDEVDVKLAPIRLTSRVAAR